MDELDVGTAHAAGNGLNQRLILVVPGLVDLVNGNPAISLDDQRFHKKRPSFNEYRNIGMSLHNKIKNKATCIYKRDHNTKHLKMQLN